MSPRPNDEGFSDMRKLILGLALAATILPVAAPVSADPPPWSHGRKHDRSRGNDRVDYRRYDWNRPDPRYRGYDAARYYRDDRSYREVRLGRNDRVYRGNDGRYYCRRSDGTTGLILGGLLGGAIGSSLDRGRSNTLGILLGAAGGAALGQSVDRGNVRCR
jgi:hypothetical protein